MPCSRARYIMSLELVDESVCPTSGAGPFACEPIFSDGGIPSLAVGGGLAV